MVINQPQEQLSSVSGKSPGNVWGATCGQQGASWDGLHILGVQAHAMKDSANDVM